MPEVQSSCQIRAETQAFVDREIKHLRRELRHQRELAERTAAKDKSALELQRTEYLRRLDELNNAHARAEKAVLATVPRETFDVHVTSYNRWREEVMSEAQSIKASQSARDRMFYLAIALIGLAFSAITVFMSFKSK